MHDPRKLTRVHGRTNAGDLSVIIIAIEPNVDFWNCLAECLDQVKDPRRVCVVTWGIASDPAWKDSEVIQRLQKVAVLHNSGASYGSALNRAWKQCDSEYVLIIPWFVQPLPGLLRAYTAPLRKNQLLACVCGTYHFILLDEYYRVIRPIAHSFDFSEKSSMGYVRAIRKSALEELRGFDGKLAWAAEYDFRLRLLARWKVEIVRHIYYRVVVSRSSLMERNFVWSAVLYFAPELREVTAFMEQDAREREMPRETRIVFRKFLRNQNALLTAKWSALKCPDKQRSPVVSVIIPVYNRKRLVVAAVESVLSGHFKDFEVIIIDNGSTDGTWEVLQELAAKCPKVRVFRSRTNNIARALNMAWTKARGKYISQLDSDDLYLPRTLESQVAYLERHPNCAVAISYYELVDKSARSLQPPRIVKHLEFDRNEILRADGAGAVRTWHRCVLEEFGGFDEKKLANYAEDYDLILKVSERYRIGRVHEVLYLYRRHSENTDRVMSDEYKQQRKWLCRRMALKRRMSIS